MSLEVERQELGGHPIARTYVDDYERVGSYYLAGPPTEVASYRQVCERVRAASGDERWKKLGSAFTDLPDHTQSRLEELVEGRGFFVSTGHQAGLFGGPLMAVYKAITAARLARDLKEQLGVPVMPLFSVASEDHDWDEVNHTYAVDLDNHLVRIELKRSSNSTESRADKDPPIARIKLDRAIENALADLRKALPDSEHSAEVIERLTAAYAPGNGFADAFERVFMDILAKFSFLVVQMSHPHIKRSTRDLLWQDWSKREESARLLRTRVEQLDSEGFAAQVQIAEHATNLFVEGKLGRDRVTWEDEKPSLRRSGERLSWQQLREMIERTPEIVSPGVLLRPIAEAKAFPVIAHVVGPAELAYTAQNQVLYQLHGIPAPVAVPRASLRLVEPKVRKVLNKYELNPESLSGDSTQTIAKILETRTPAALKRSLNELRATLEAAVESVANAALEYDSGAESAIGSGKRAIETGIESLEKKLKARVKEKNDVMRQHLEKAAVNLYPAGQPQERILNVHPFLARYGPELLDRVYEACAVTLE